ncbi:MAG TPA: hypothetical protein VIO38_06615 [Rariglobus sp.]
MKPRDHQRLFPRPEGEISKKDDLLESLPESKRWDPLPGSEGRQAPESADEDEDAEGRSETEQLVDDGVEEAEREQVKQAARAAKKQT